jgi:hypothetical protein
MAELAEAMQGVLDANEHYRNVRNLPGNTDRLRADTDAKLTAAAERLDKAMAEAVREALRPMNDEEKTQRALKAIVGVPMF